MTRDEALDLLKEHLKNKNLVKHYPYPSRPA